MKSEKQKKLSFEVETKKYKTMPNPEDPYSLEHLEFEAEQKKSIDFIESLVRRGLATIETQKDFANLEYWIIRRLSDNEILLKTYDRKEIENLLKIAPR